MEKFNEIFHKTRKAISMANGKEYSKIVNYFRKNCTRPDPIDYAKINKLSKKTKIAIYDLVNREQHSRENIEDDYYCDHSQIFATDFEYIQMVQKRWQALVVKNIPQKMYIQFCMYRTTYSSEGEHCEWIISKLFELRVCNDFVEMVDIDYCWESLQLVMRKEIVKNETGYWEELVFLRGYIHALSCVKNPPVINNQCAPLKNWPSSRVIVVGNIEYKHDFGCDYVKNCWYNLFFM